MISKNYKYNGFDFSASKVFETKTWLVDVGHMTDQRTDIKNNANMHWSVASNTLEWGRRIDFNWEIFWITKAERGAAWRKLNEHIYIEPYLNKDPFKKLEFKTDEGEDRWVMAKVNEKPFPENGMNDSKIRFSFSLYSNTNEVYWAELNSHSSMSTTTGGTRFPNKLWDSWGQAQTDIGVIENKGNFNAWCKIQVLGEVRNPRVKNLTNWLEFKIKDRTTNLTLNSMGGDWTATDGGVNVMDRRLFWDPIFLSPGINEVVVVGDSGAYVPYTVTWYDTWNTI